MNIEQFRRNTMIGLNEMTNTGMTTMLASGALIVILLFQFLVN